MKIILSGYGKMNKEVEKVALDRGHKIVARFDNEQEWEYFDQKRNQADLVIDFSMPNVAVNNFIRCFEAGLPVVTGTTGWLDQLDSVTKMVIEKDYSFFYSPNFSLGVNIFFNMNKQLAKIMDDLKNYELKIKESHHIQKIDKPSGTAIKIANDILAISKHLKTWSTESKDDPSEIVIYSERKGEVPGTHEIIWESDADKIVLKHEAKNREGFAIGAVVAAEFLKGKKGVFTMEDLLTSIF